MKAVILSLALLPTLADAGVLAAARTLPAGTIISAGDLVASDSDKPGISDPSQAIGMQTRITIYEGRPLQSTLLQAPKLVSRNQIVQMNFIRGSLRIVTEARCMTEGAAGDIIRVMNVESRTTVSAQVQPDGTLLALN